MGEDVEGRDRPAPSPDDQPRRRRVARALLLLPVLAWVVGTPGMALTAVGQTLTFLGGQPTPDEVRAGEVWWTWTAVYAVVVPVVGLLVARLARSRRGLWLYLVALVLAATPVLGWWAVTAEPPEPPASPYPVCQERSGGDTDCPGG